ncbi:MAG: aldo/keto reductase [Candidatus Marinimicrobia bacterium]|nr:aldo/keto reductase [Candidatus Neomarinimicrobiota bacterium]
MRYRYLGKSGLRVSKLSLGGWLTLGGTVEESRSVAIIHKAFDIGVNLFDMADVYSEGMAEVVLGKAARDLPREQLVVATKVFGRMHPGPMGAGLSKKHIIEACHASLRRLKMDYIDLYQFHSFDLDTPLEESLEALEILVRQGKILYAGCSNFNGEQVTTAMELAINNSFPRFISSQPCYNLLERDVEETLFPACKKFGVGNIIYSPLAHGVLTGKYTVDEPDPPGSRSATNGGKFMSRYLTRENLQRSERLKKLAQELGYSLAQLALAWILRRAEVASVILGVTSLDQLEHNLAAGEIKLINEEIERIEDCL